MWRAKAGLAARPRSGLVGLLQIGLATDVVGGPVCGFTRATGTFRRQGPFQTRAGEREQDVECCARGVRGCFLPVVVPKAAPLVVLSLLFQRHRKTEVSEKERPLALREMVPLFAAGSAHTYSRRPRSTPAAAAHLVACRGRWRKAAAATTLVGQARPAALREKQTGPAKTPPPRGGRGHRRLEAKDGGGTSPLGPHTCGARPACARPVLNAGVRAVALGDPPGAWLPGRDIRRTVTSPQACSSAVGAVWKGHSLSAGQGHLAPPWGQAAPR